MAILGSRSSTGVEKKPRVLFSRGAEIRLGRNLELVRGRQLRKKKKGPGGKREKRSIFRGGQEE